MKILLLMTALALAQEKSPFQSTPASFSKKVAACQESLAKAGIEGGANAVGKDFYVVSQNDPDGHPGETLYYYRRQGDELKLFTVLLRGRATVRAPLTVAIPGGPTLRVRALVGPQSAPGPAYVADEASSHASEAASPVELSKPFAESTALEYLAGVIQDGVGRAAGEVSASFSDVRLLYPSEAVARQALAADARRLRTDGAKLLAALDACLALGEGKSNGAQLFKLTTGGTRERLAEFLKAPATSAPAAGDSH